MPGARDAAAVTDRGRVASGVEVEQPRAQFTATATTFSGPIPPPAILEQYARIIPDLPERIVAQFENQSTHRRGLETKVVDGGIVAQKMGSVFGFTIAMTCLLGGFWLLHGGKDAAGIASIITAVAAPTGVFVWGRLRQERERKEKLAALELAAKGEPPG